MRQRFISTMGHGRSVLASFGKIAGAALLFGAAAAHATYPEKPIRVVVATAVGTPIDIVTRVVTTRMSKDLGQPVIVDNKPGATGTVGAVDVLRNANDGYTLMTLFMPITVAPAIQDKMPYDLRRDFAPVAQTAWSYNVLVTHPSVPANSVSELISLLKANPGKFSYATGGLGTPAHISGELFKMQNKVFALHVPYNQFGQALTDLVGGSHQFMFAATAPVLQFIAQGRLKPLAVTSPQRIASMPQVPTMVELGYKDMVVRDWQGFAAKTGTPPEIIARLNKSVAVAMADPDVIKTLAAIGVDPATGSPGDFAALINSELSRWATVAKAQGLKSN